MTVARTTLLDLPIITTGTESGLWGDYTNNGLTQYLDIAIAGMSNLTSANFTAGALTIETTEGTDVATNISATSAQYAGFRVTSLATNSTITVGNTGTNPGRSYRLINADSTYTLTFKATGQTGVTLQPGQSAVVAFNGTDYVFVGVVLNAAQTFTATQTVRAAPTQDGVALAGRAGGTSSYAATFTPTTLSANRTLTIPDASGTILQSGTAVTVAQGGTGATTLTGVLKGNGTSAFTASNVSLSSEVTGTLPVANGGTGATTLTGVLKGNGTSAFTASNVSLSSEVTGTLPVANGGTGAATLTANNVILGNGTSAVQFVAPGANGNVLTSNGTTWVSSAAGASGTVTSVAMTVPAFLSVSGSPITSSGTLAVSYSGTALPVANGGTGATTLTGVLKGNGTSAFSAATAGTDYVAPATATTFTALQTFSGSTSVAATKLANAKEVATISATAATGTIAYDVTTQSVLYYTSNASANWTVNFRGSSGTSLNTLMSTGESITAAFLVTQGSTAYYNSAVQVDGSSVTPKWQGGTAPSAGNASSIDAYVYTIVKTGSATFTVFASQTKFA